MTLAPYIRFVKYEVAKGEIALRGMWKTTTTCPNLR